ncbi:GNAT family N-acetyltransferase [Streptomyces lasiicapitis]|uniref:N-acetyltransferase n=1 Tax=Streptomyces lasiicapitis TaxID=1923961 RepID=A0ABQ2M2N1_9ACTN|nr:GNAT family N-acetyltransferase [Streptomyces lasiicapitis]GGO46005.1 N-acetyltransferase [Streptomyces lasiicapitis]
MEEPDSLEARALSKDCVPAWLELHEAVERVDRTGEHVDAEELAEALSDPKLDLERDSLGLWDGPRLIAHAVVYTPHGAVDAARFQGDAAVHPEWRRRGIGTRLVTWMLARAEDLHAADAELSALPGELLLDGKAADEALLKLTDRCGFTACRWWFDMKQPLDGERPDPRPAPEGTRLVPFAEAYDEATRLAHNDAFRDHWNFTVFDSTDWRTWVTGATSFRPAMSRLLLAGDEVAAYLLAEESEAKTAATGSRDCHVGFLGTRRSFRGRGAAPALLTDVLRTAREAGYDTVSLTVDTVNPSGALGFYEQSGFAVDRESVTYARALGASEG